MDGPFDLMTATKRAECLDLLQSVLRDMRLSEYGPAEAKMALVVSKAQASGAIPRGSRAARSAAASLLAQGTLYDLTPELDKARQALVRLGDPSLVRGVVEDLGGKGPSIAAKMAEAWRSEGHGDAWIEAMLKGEAEDLARLIWKDNPGMATAQALALAWHTLRAPRA